LWWFDAADASNHHKNRAVTPRRQTLGMDERWELVCALAEDQHGAFVTAQVDEFGVDAGWLRRQERDRRIGRLARGAYGVFALLDDWTPMAATQLLVPRAVATGRAGGVLHGFDGLDAVAMDILVPRNVNLRGPLVCRTADLVVPEIVIIEGLRCTDDVRTIIELARVVDRHHVERAIESLLRRRPEAEALLRDRATALARRGKSGPQVVLHVLDHRPATPTDSDLETVYWQVLVDHGVPLPTRQHEVHIGGRRVATLDMAWPAERVFVETDGWASHGSRQAFGHDRRRQNALVIEGWVPLRFTDSDVRSFARRTAYLTKAMLDRRRAELVVASRV
jgi:very-short-patch-repair endonuclease